MHESSYNFTLTGTVFLLVLIHFVRTMTNSSKYSLSTKLPLLWFLPRDAMLKRGLCCRPVSVRPSVTLMHFIHTAEDIVNFLSRPGSLITLLFDYQRRYPIPREPLQQGCKIHWGGNIVQFSTEIAIYLVNSTR